MYVRWLNTLRCCALEMPSCGILEWWVIRWWKIFYNVLNHFDTITVWWTDIHPGGWIWYSIIALCIGMLCLCITTPSTIIIIILMLLLLCSRCPLLVDLVITCEVDRIHRQVMSAPKCSVSLVSALETEWRRFVWWTTRLHSLWICSHPMKINQWPTVSVT